MTMTYRRLYNELKEKANTLGKEESAVKIIILETTGFTLSELIMNFDSPTPAGTREKIIKNFSAYAEKNIPVQYIFGFAHFYGLRLKVNESVLIPRPETEILVDIALDRLRGYDNPAILDLCCGSGAIALALKKNLPASNITAVDISPAALKTAAENARDYNLEISFILSDLFAEVTGKYDAIVSNPPYLAGEHEAEPIVRNNEPPGALYAPDQGLRFYSRIFDEARGYLKKAGIIILEIPANKKNEIMALAAKSGLAGRATVEKDLSDRDRVMIIKTD